MATLGYGYGSEFQLLRFMGRHRIFLENAIKEQIIKEGEIHWLDFGFIDLDKDPIGDKEETGLDFLNHIDFVSQTQINAVKKECNYYKVTEMISKQSWDALFTIDDTLYLVEAKAYCNEMKTPKEKQKRKTNNEILNFMKQMMWPIEVSEKWLKDYYQLANRLATTALLNKHGIKTKTMCLFFINGYKKRNNRLIIENNDTNQSQFEQAIKEEMEELGITYEKIKDFITPHVFINANPYMEING